MNTGKPDRIMLETAMGLLHLDAQDCVMVGDRLSTDIAMAVGAGMDSALVLTGEATLEAARSCREDQRPSLFSIASTSCCYDASDRRRSGSQCP